MNGELIVKFSENMFVYNETYNMYDSRAILPLLESQYENYKNYIKNWTITYYQG